MNDENVEKWDFMNDDEADFLRKIMGIMHHYYGDKPKDFIIIAVFLLQKRTEQIDGPQINDLWKGDQN